MGNRIAFALAGVVLALGIAGMVVAYHEMELRQAFVPSDKPVSEDIIKQKMQEAKYNDIQVMHLGSAFVTTGVKDGRTDTFVVDARSGRLMTAGDDDA